MCLSQTLQSTLINNLSKTRVVKERDGSCAYVEKKTQGNPELLLQNNVLSKKHLILSISRDLAFCEQNNTHKWNLLPSKLTLHLPTYLLAHKFRNFQRSLPPATSDTSFFLSDSSQHPLNVSQQKEQSQQKHITIRWNKKLCPSWFLSSVFSSPSYLSELNHIIQPIST